ncbi:uncharacterized protein [Anomalospiza imberbis]|uniref:uncharacterized protein n=1 Tax=Anomalospiza imberbis TaxID=187417 RepID=UPI00358E9B81
MIFPLSSLNLRIDVRPLFSRLTQVPAAHLPPLREPNLRVKQAWPERDLSNHEPALISTERGAARAAARPEPPGAAPAPPARAGTAPRARGRERRRSAPWRRPPEPRDVLETARAFAASPRLPPAHSPPPKALRSEQPPNPLLASSPCPRSCPPVPTRYFLPIPPFFPSSIPLFSRSFLPAAPTPPPHRVPSPSWHSAPSLQPPFFLPLPHTASLIAAAPFLLPPPSPSRPRRFSSPALPPRAPPSILHPHGWGTIH